MRPTGIRRGSENHPNFLHFLQILTDLPQDQLLLSRFAGRSVTFPR